MSWLAVGRTLVYCCCCFLFQNFPLYLRTAAPQSETDLQFQYLVHASIDVIEEKSKLWPWPIFGWLLCQGEGMGGCLWEHYEGAVEP